MFPDVSNLLVLHTLSFAADGMALALAQELVKQADFDQLPVDRRDFALLPFMHSESPIIHAAALRLYQRYASTRSLRAETEHKRVIDQFGRYPYRNQALGRRSTPEERRWLNQQR